MSVLDDAERAHAFLAKLASLEPRSPWVAGREREFAVVMEALQRAITEWRDRERHFRAAERA